MRIAIPVLKGQLAEDFKGHKQFDVIDIVSKELKQQNSLTPPLIEPWRLPCWLRDHDVDILIVGKINESMIKLFQKAGIKVVKGAPSLLPVKVAQKYVTETLVMN